MDIFLCNPPPFKFKLRLWNLPQDGSLSALASPLKYGLTRSWLHNRQGRIIELCERHQIKFKYIDSRASSNSQCLDMCGYWLLPTGYQLKIHNHHCDKPLPQSVGLLDQNLVVFPITAIRLTVGAPGRSFIRSSW